MTTIDELLVVVFLSVRTGFPTTLLILFSFVFHCMHCFRAYHAIVLQIKSGSVIATSRNKAQFGRQDCDYGRLYLCVRTVLAELRGAASHH